MSVSQQEGETPMAHQQLHSDDEPNTTLSQKFKDKLRWTPAHQEKYSSISANWSRDDYRNHVAEKVVA